MNLFKSVKNMKGASGAIKAGMIILALAFIVASVSYIIPAFAATHDSHVFLNTTIVKGGLNYGFKLTVYNDGGANISEFRIYNNTAELNGGLSPFTNLVCYPVDNWYGPFYIPSSTGDYCQYTAKTSAYHILPGQNENFTFNADAPIDDCWRTWHFETRDPSGFYRPIYTQVAVDALKPITTKSFIGPNKTDQNGVEWIDGVTLINLTAIDQQPHPSNVSKTYYKNILYDGETPCWSQSACNELKLLSEQYGGEWKTYIEPFPKEEESCHVLWYYSVDNVANVEDMKVNCFFVDLTKPEIEKVVGDNKIEGDHNPVHWWITQNTPITLKCQDVGPHPSNGVTIYWKYTVDGGLPIEGSHKGESYDLYFKEDSVHVLEFWCKDAVEKESVHDIETFKVDTEEPKITKTLKGPWVGDCLPRPGTDDKCYIKDWTRTEGTTIHVEVVDPDPTGMGCNINEIECKWGYYLDGEWHDGQSELTPPFDIKFYEDSTHELHIKCIDKLGNEVEDVETFLVDSTPPETTKVYGDPTYVEGDYRWITSDTPITLTAKDEKVGVSKLYWRNTLLKGVSDYDCIEKCNFDGDGDWNTVDGDHVTIYKKEESCHLIEFQSEDKLGNIEDIKKQCVFVDNSVPEPHKDVGEPKKEAEGEFGYWVTTSTPITLDCDDTWDGDAAHPVDHEKVWWRFSTLVDDKWVKGDWQSSTKLPVIVHFKEDSYHDLEYFCEDKLGNAGESDTEYFIVEGQPPVTTKSYEGPFYMDKETGAEWIDTATLVRLDATDPEPHPSGVKATWYDIIPADDYYCQSEENCEEWGIGTKWTLYEKPFPITEESCHIIEFYSEDNLGNQEDVKWQCVFVDKTPPVIEKKYGEPHYPIELGDYPHWINSSTPIEITANDPEPHPSGLKSLEYRVTLIKDNEVCKDEKLCEDALGEGDWLPVPKGPVFINKESCHLIEIKAVDNVDKTSTHKQCVYVENTPPKVTKTISDPKEQWEGDNIFYPDLTERCRSTIECWKITLGNTLDITCTDPEPHPVDNNKMCFQIELDGTDPEDDRTEKYCNAYGGVFEDGWCCKDEGILDFQFLEESQHDLKVKCVDALGNEGKIDEEKFKVEGCTDELCLFKKWNLISVPFTLLNDDPEAVFGEIKDKIVGVWTYDNGVWYVWTPDDGPDTLTNIKPGYGYWVLAKEDVCIEIAGSLYAAVEVPPARELEGGWNLIGYYGNTMMQDSVTFGVDGAGRCIIPSKYVYCALNSLVNTFRGFPRWSSLVSYNNMGDDSAFRGLNACCEYVEGEGVWCPESMDPGKGYWVFMLDENGDYAPADNCIWDEDLHCVGMPRLG